MILTGDVLSEEIQRLLQPFCLWFGSLNSWYICQARPSLISLKASGLAAHEIAVS